VQWFPSRCAADITATHTGEQVIRPIRFRRIALHMDTGSVFIHRGFILQLLTN
jgi:hypothetical protein